MQITLDTTQAEVLCEVLTARLDRLQDERAGTSINEIEQLEIDIAILVDILDKL